MAIEAVIFDYGMVLSGTPDAGAGAEMMRITGLGEKLFETNYWTDRHAYDEGKLNGISFWRKLVGDAGLSDRLGEAEIAELNRQDARYWTVEDPSMIAWQKQLKELGMKTAILSNMGDAVCESITRSFDWIENFDLCVWSYQLGIAKPAAEIFLHTLHQLHVAPENALFLDDKSENIAAARAVGMLALQFSSVAQLRADMLAAELNRELPLPE